MRMALLSQCLESFLSKTCLCSLSTSTYLLGTDYYLHKKKKKKIHHKSELCLSGDVKQNWDVNHWWREIAWLYDVPFWYFTDTHTIMPQVISYIFQVYTADTISHTITTLPIDRVRVRSRRYFLTTLVPCQDRAQVWKKQWFGVTVQGTSTVRIIAPQSYDSPV